MTAPVELYGFWRSQATFRVRVALNLKGLAYREIPVALDAGAQNVPDFRQLNPSGALPVLKIDGLVLTQSMAILEYLEETRPVPALLPPDPPGRARVRALAALAASDAHPLIVPRVRRWLADHAGIDDALWKAWQTRWFAAGLEGYEARLAGSDATRGFCHGDTPTLADICLCGLYAGAKTFGIEVADIPTVRRIVAHAMTLPTFDAARAERQADFPGADPGASSRPPVP